MNPKTLATWKAALGVIGAIVGVAGGIGGPFYFLGGLQSRVTTNEADISDMKKKFDFEGRLSYVEGTLGVRKRDPVAPSPAPGAATRD